MAPPAANRLLPRRVHLDVRVSEVQQRNRNSWNSAKKGKFLRHHEGVKTLQRSRAAGADSADFVPFVVSSCGDVGPRGLEFLREAAKAASLAPVAWTWWQRRLVESVLKDNRLIRERWVQQLNGAMRSQARRMNRSAPPLLDGG